MKLIKEGGQWHLDCKNNGDSGIRLTLNRGKKTLSIWGWYDNCVGIEGDEISLAELIRLFDPKTKLEASK